MATRRKRTARRRLRLGPLPRWGLLAVGLAVGIALTAIGQLVVERARSPGTGLNTLLTRAEKPRAASTETPAAPTAEPRPKPRYDFYTILPEIETVLPEKAEGTDSRSAKQAAVEPGAHYVLQAASFARFEDADRLKAKLALNGLVAHIQKVSIEGRGEYHRVRLGPYTGFQELDAVDRRLRELGIRALRLKLTRES